MQRSQVSQPTAAKTETAPRSFAWPRLLLLAGLLLLLLGLGWKAFRVYRLVSSLQDHRLQAETMLADGRRNLDPAKLETLLLDVRADVLGLDREARPFLPITGALGWLPQVGPLLVAAPQFLEIADAGTAAAVYGVRGLGPALTLMGQGASGTDLLPQLLPLLEKAEPELAQVSRQVERIAAARAEIENVERMPERVQQLIARADALLPAAQDGLKLVPVLPALLGVDGPRTYLILAQNEDELRATGGFISGAGLLTIADGRIVALDFEDATPIVDYSKPYDISPPPLERFMGLGLLVFRDANYWPDFPTSAAKAMELYAFTTGTPVDGVIAIDQRFVERLVCAVGPVYPAELNTMIDCNNALSSIQQAYGLDAEAESFNQAVAERKSFMGPLAGAIQAKMFADPANLDLTAVVSALSQSVAERHLQLYVPDPAVAAVLDEIDWDNQLQNETGQDLLMVVDSNMGYNKANGIVERAIDYAVALADRTATVTLTYSNGAAPLDAPCDPGLPAYDYDMTYDELVDDCYWNYVRIYAPSGSELLSADRHPEPADMFITNLPWDGEAETIEDPSGLAVFGNFLLVRPTQTVSSSYNYTLPDAVSQAGDDGRRTYHLTVRKQAGTVADPLAVRVTLPPGARLLEATPTPTAVEGDTIVFAADLEVDRTFSIVYR